MNNVGKYLLIVGLIVLALFVGILIGRRMGAPASPIAANSTGVQITTNAPVANTPPPQPLPAPVQAPPPAPVAKPSVDQQVQDDAAAVGMTTREAPASQAPPANSAPAAPTPTTPPAPSDAGDDTAPH